MKHEITVSVFLGESESLKILYESGTLLRDLALYRQLQNKDVRINIVSFGGREEFGFARQLPGMRILCNAIGLPARTYSRRLHQVHGFHLARSNLLKSHLTTGVMTAMRASCAWQVPLIARMGWVWSINSGKLRPRGHPFTQKVDWIERRALSAAHHVIATTQEIADTLCGIVPAAAGKMTIIPNHVDSELFRPLPEDKIYDLVYVGRIHRIKNLEALLMAVESTGLSIAMIGSPTVLAGGTAENDTLMHQLQRKFGALNGRISWIGRVQNEDMPAYFNQAKILVLPSLAEGHPRALIEAMACGMPIIGTNVFGINNVLQHEETGYLCETDADSIAAAIETVLSKPTLMQTMGENARNFAVEHYSLEQLAQTRVRPATRGGRAQSRQQRAAPGRPNTCSGGTHHWCKIATANNRKG